MAILTPTSNKGIGVQKATLGAQKDLSKIGKGRTVLIADDMPTMRMVLGNPCRQLGFKVEYATNGKDALERVLLGETHPDQRIDLFLCDWFMPPGIDGIEVLEELQEKGVMDGEMIFFMITAQDSINEVFRAAESILPGYLTKTHFTVAQLERKIQAAMKMQDYRFDLQDTISLDKQNVGEKNMMTKYNKSIAHCKRIFKEIQEERTAKVREMQKSRVLFLTRKVHEAQKMVGDYGQEQREKLMKMLQKAKKDLMSPAIVEVPTWPLRKIAELFEDEGWLDAALQQYQAILNKINPHSAWVNVDVGRVFEKKGEYNKAIMYYRRAIVLNKKFQKGRDCLANLYKKLGRANEAIEVLKEAVELSPEKPDRLKIKGDIHLSLGTEQEAEKAEGCYLKVLDIEEKLDKKQIDNNINVGKAIMVQPKRVHHAKEFLDRAIELSSKAAYKSSSDVVKKARLTRGEFFVKTGDLESAQKDFDSGLKLEEDEGCELNNNQVSGEIGDIYFRNGHDKEAMEWMSSFISKDPKNQEKQTVLKEVLTKNNRYDEADRIIESALDKAFQHVKEINTQCREYRKNGMFHEAVTHYNQVMLEHPSDEGLWFNKGRALYDYANFLKNQNYDQYEKRLQESKYHFKKAIELEKTYLLKGGKPRIIEALHALKLEENFLRDILPKAKTKTEVDHD